MQKFRVEGVDLAYQDVGQGPAVLLLHAFPLSSEMFAAQVAALSSKYRVITPDHRGFGQSGLGVEVLTMSRLADDVVALLDHLKIERAVVGGVSMGGYAAMALLSEHPDRLSALMLIDTQMGADDKAAKSKREQTAVAVETEGMGVLVESMLPNLLGADAKPAVKRQVEEMILANTAAGSAAALRGLAKRLDSKELLRAFTKPALVVVGAEDILTPPDKSKAMAKTIPNARLVEISGAGHLANLEHPQEMNRVLSSFLSYVALSKLL